MSEDTEETKAIVSRNHGLDLVHPALQPQTRFELARLAISGYLTTGVPVDQPSAFAAGLERADYAGPSDFWEDFLSRPVKIGDFIFFVSSLHFSPSMNGVDLIKMTLRDLFKTAVQLEEPFILKARLIEPRGAVRWLLSSRLNRSLVPVELAQHLEGPKQGVLLVADEANEVAADAEKSSPPRRKRPATQVPDVVRALREIYPSGQQTANCTAMLEVVRGYLRRPTISSSTLDRARAKAWSASSIVTS